jgi:hypothetical protein
VGLFYWYLLVVAMVAALAALCTEMLLMLI